MDEFLNNLKELPNSSVFIEARKGLPVLEYIEDFLQDILKTTDVRTHPDYYLVRAEESKSSIGVETSDIISQRMRYQPSIADKIYLVIDGIDRFTPQAQNKLLKLFEDAANVRSFVVSYGGRNVLPTIKSRLVPMKLHPIHGDEFCQYCNKNGIKNWQMWETITQGCPLLINELLPLEAVFLSVESAASALDKKALLNALSLVKEKDTKADKYKAYYRQIFDLIWYAARPRVLLLPPDKQSCFLELIETNRKNCQLTSYTKDSFFYAIAALPF